MINRLLTFILSIAISTLLHSKPNNSLGYISLETSTTLVDSTPTYNPMAIEGANWLYKIKNEGQVTYYGWRLQGDTIVNGYTYKKGYRITVDLLVAPPYQELVYAINSGFPSFYIRDDTLQKKVFVINQQLSDNFNCNDPESIAQEKLLFNFSVPIDSSIYCDNGNHTVTDIDTVEYFGYSLPRIILSGGPRTQYQQIGNTNDLFLDINNFWVASYSEELIEYCVSDEVGCPHELPLSSKEFTENEHIIIYPNPAGNVLNIRADDNINSIITCTIDGRYILKNQNINTRTTKVDLSEINSQTLVILIKMENGNLVRKLVQKY